MKKSNKNKTGIVLGIILGCLALLTVIAGIIIGITSRNADDSTDTSQPSDGSGENPDLPTDWF
ncbi:MAG: hypothetical protein ACI3XE_01000 [Eubacteriales bacterium]